MRKTGSAILCISAVLLAGKPESLKKQIFKSIQLSADQPSFQREKSQPALEKFRLDIFKGDSIDQGKLERGLLDLLWPPNQNQVLVSQHLLGEWNSLEKVKIRKDKRFEILIGNPEHKLGISIEGILKGTHPEISKWWFTVLE